MSHSTGFVLYGRVLKIDAVLSCQRCYLMLGGAVVVKWISRPFTNLETVVLIDQYGRPSMPRFERANAR